MPYLSRWIFLFSKSVNIQLVRVKRGKSLRTKFHRKLQKTGLRLDLITNYCPFFSSDIFTQNICLNIINRIYADQFEGCTYIRQVIVKTKREGKLNKIQFYKMERFFKLSGDQFSSVTQLCPTLCDSMDCSTPGFPVHHQLPELAQTHVRWVGDAIQPSHPLSSPSPPAFSLSQHQGLFQWVSSLHEVAKYWSFSISISPSNEYSELISSRIDWLDLLAVQGTLKSLLQHHGSKMSVLWHSAFLIV